MHRRCFSNCLTESLHGRRVSSFIMKENIKKEKCWNWLADAVFYEIYPQSFQDTNGDGVGDIPGMIKRLDYIKELGCNAIWVNPW